ncbi:MAG: thioesterase family protein [Syntrophales bacterium]|nr:thioesterase family protein [Syntrophales bacterium]
MKNIVKVRVTYADTDAMSIVYHTNYIKWFEIGRTELLREKGVVYAEMESLGYNLPVIELWCHYLLPARYDQIVLVETEIVHMRRASIKFNYSIWDENKKDVLVEGSTSHACTSKEGKIVRLPAFIMEKVNQEDQTQK